MLDRLAALDTQDPKWFTHIVAYRLLVQYIKFIKDCGFVISKKKMLKVLNEKFDLKWNQPDYLDDVSMVVCYRLQQAHCELTLDSFSSLGRLLDLQISMNLRRRM